MTQDKAGHERLEAAAVAWPGRFPCAQCSSVFKRGDHGHYSCPPTSPAKSFSLGHSTAVGISAIAENTTSFLAEDMRSKMV